MEYLIQEEKSLRNGNILQKAFFYIVLVPLICIILYPILILVIFIGEYKCKSKDCKNNKDKIIIILIMLLHAFIIFISLFEGLFPNNNMEEEQDETSI